MPYGGNQHQVKYLSNFSQKYSNGEFIADKIFTSDIPVAKESDSWPVYNIERRIEQTLRANKSPANMISWGVSNTTYSLEEHALADIVTERDRINSDPPISADIDTVENLTDAILLKQEQLTSKLFMTTTSWGNNTTLVTATSWASDTTTASPIVNMLSATSLILRSSGVKPNLVILGWQVFESLKELTIIHERIKYTEKSIVTADLLAALFDVDRVLVGSSSYNTAAEGLTPTTTFLWGNSAWIGYMNPSPGKKKVSAAVRLRMNGRSAPYRVKRWKEERLDGDIVEVSTMSKPIAVATASAYLFQTPILT